MEFLNGKKTYLFAALAALLTAWQAVNSGTFDAASAQAVLESFALMALRAGVSKAGLK
jgi:hypothetical protein